MGFLSVLLIALGLAMDCFAVSLCIGTSPVHMDKRSIARLAFHFGFFQGGMTALGWLAGSTVVNLISGFDHWIAFLLLGWVGVKMIIESFSNKEEEAPANPSKGTSLIMLSIATSIDALAVGLSLAMVDGSILFASLTIGAVSLILSEAGVLIGDKLGCKFGKRMELLGGIILIGIGLRVLLSHLLG